MCTEIEILAIINILRTIVKIISIVLPIVLVISLMITIVKNTFFTSESDFLKPILMQSKSKIIAACLIFFIPLILSTMFSLINENTTYESCWDNATTENMNILANKQIKDAISSLDKNSSLDDAFKADNLLTYITDDEKKKEYKDQIDKIKEEILKRLEEEKKKDDVIDDEPIITGPIETVNGIQYAGNKVINSKFTSIDVKSDKIGCPVTFNNSPLSSLYVNTIISDQLIDILKQICTYIKGNSYINPKEIGTAGVYNGGSNVTYPHHYGLGIDLSSIWQYTYKGKTYTPYSGQGSSTAKAYKNFICDVCNGKEDCPQNINYQIYVRFFKQKGWCWGGNWSESSFDPMHYEVKKPWSSTCSTSRKMVIDCSNR